MTETDWPTILVIYIFLLGGIQHNAATTMLALKRKREAQARAAAASPPPSVLSDHANTEGPAPSKPRKKRTPAEIRLQKDLSAVEADDAATLIFPNLDNLKNFRLSVAPRRGLWCGGEYDFVFSVQESYPFTPPRVYCETKIYHPNVSFCDGGVCLGLRDWWKPVHDLSTVIHGLVSMFYEPQTDVSVNPQAAELLRENHDQFVRVVNWTRRMMNDVKPKNQTFGHCILDVLPPEMVRSVMDFLDEEALMKFFMAALGSVPHQYIYTSVARRVVCYRLTSLREQMALPGISIPRQVLTFVSRFASNVEQQDASTRMPSELSQGNAGISERAGFFSNGRPQAQEQQVVAEDHDNRSGNGIVQVVRSLSGRMAVLHYFRDAITKSSSEDILWPVWCGKLSLGSSRDGFSPSMMISTPTWYPTILQRCKQAFFNEYCSRATLPGWDMARRFERGLNFTLATITGVSSKDVEVLSTVEGRRLFRFRHESAAADSFCGMALVPPEDARELLHRLIRVRAQQQNAAAMGPPAPVLRPGLDHRPLRLQLPPLPPAPFDELQLPPLPPAPFDELQQQDEQQAQQRPMPLAQYERIVQAESTSSQLFCLWEDTEDREADDAELTCEQFTKDVVELLTTRKSVQLLSNLPEYWHAGEWETPPTMICHRSTAASLARDEADAADAGAVFERHLRGAGRRALALQRFHARRAEMMEEMFAIEDMFP